MKFLSTQLLILFITNSAFGARILFLFSTPSKSHMIIVHALSTALAEKGHEVTVVTPFPLEKPIKNHREIVVPFNSEVKETMKTIIDTSSKSFLRMIYMMLKANFQQMEEVFISEEFQKITNEKFDMIVIGMNFQNALLGFAEKFDCPVIVLSIQRHVIFTNVMVGNPMAVNANPHLNIAKYDMNFVDRVKNFAFFGADMLFYTFAHYKQKAIYE